MTAVRDAEPADLKPLAHLWWTGWRDGHEGLLPDALKRLRTLESFEDRMAAALPKVRTLGPVGAPLGFHLLRTTSSISSTWPPRRAGPARRRC
nr:hypothetical protein [Caulobacter sp. Root487D2Y]